MSGVTQVEIKESASTLKELLKQQNTPLNYSKVQALYFLKSHKCETVQSAANLVGRHRIWLLALQDIPVSYMTAYRLTREELKSKLKVPRPRHIRQKPGASEEFRENLPQKLKTEKEKIKSRWEYKRKLRFWNGDETRIGMKTKMEKVITLKGVKPIGNPQWEFKNYYVYGAIEPETGELFGCEFSHLNRDCFEVFLQQMSDYYPEDIHIIQVDNAPFHTSNDWEVPENIVLLFQPPYCPEVNTSERLWESLKRFLRWMVFGSLDDLKREVFEWLESRSRETLKSLTGWDYILQALSVAQF